LYYNISPHKQSHSNIYQNNLAYQIWKDSVRLFIRVSSDLWTGLQHLVNANQP
jgi:hypothetical protein